MGWIAAVASLAGTAISTYGSSQKSGQSTLPATFYNAYGEPNTPAAGAIQSRNNIFDSINSDAFNNATTGASYNYANALNNAANSPQLAAAGKYTSDELAGNYLNSPQVKGYADQAYNSIISQGRNADARTRANFANNGLGFSTAMTQAQQAGTAASSEQASTTRAGILADNYQKERQLQQGAVANTENLVNAPLNYLSQVNSALYAPYNSQANITTGLLGQQTNNPQNTYVQNPNPYSAIGTGLTSLGNIDFSSLGNSGGTGLSDAGAIDVANQCWVAREVYGATSPEWKEFRDVMLANMPEEFIKFYQQHGPEIAEQIKGQPDVKKFIRGLMDYIKNGALAPV